MAEYIERDKVMFPYMHTKLWGMNNDTRKAYNEGVKATEDAFKAMPAADVVERKRGEWKNIIHAMVDTTGDCSECNKQAVWRTRNKPYAICPHCGARMDGGNDNG